MWVVFFRKTQPPNPSCSYSLHGLPCSIITSSIHCSFILRHLRFRLVRLSKNTPETLSLLTMSLIVDSKDLKISLNVIRAATNNFGDNPIGRGGFRDVFKGEVIIKNKGARMLAFKRLNLNRFGQGDAEFWEEIMLLSQLKHPNLVKFLHVCSEDNERILAYKYASRRSLDYYLGDASLTWTQRLDICLGAANGIAYLHDQQRVFHRDIKSSNILLDYKWIVKLSHFGLSSDPAYILSKESDVYSFGVVLVEIMCGTLSSTYDHYQRRLVSSIPHWKNCYLQDRLDSIVFPGIKEQIEPRSLSTFADIAHRCLNEHPKERPNMVEIRNELKAAIYQQLNIRPKYKHLNWIWTALICLYVCFMVIGECYYMYS